MEGDSLFIVAPKEMPAGECYFGALDGEWMKGTMGEWEGIMSEWLGRREMAEGWGAWTKKSPLLTRSCWWRHRYEGCSTNVGHERHLTPEFKLEIIIPTLVSIHIFLSIIIHPFRAPQDETKRKSCMGIPARSRARLLPAAPSQSLTP